MMIEDQDFLVRPAKLEDKKLLRELLREESFKQLHLGWHPPLSWIGSQPFFVLVQNQELSAALACPPDDDGNTWLNLFAVAPDFPIEKAWSKLWIKSLNWLIGHTSIQRVNSLVIKDQMLDLLINSGFQELNQVVVLVWEPTRAQWPIQKKKYHIREIMDDDLPRVFEIDQDAFEPIWRNSLNHLRYACQEAFSATVVDINGTPVGYQISTWNPGGGHLARLAVDPAFQKQGIASSLVEDLLDSFQRQGIVQITVNTQIKNQASIHLYQKFGFKGIGEKYPVYQYIMDRRADHEKYQT